MNGIYIVIGAIVVVVVVFVTLSLVGMRGRGKLIECPACGERFKRPTFAEKRNGIGFSLPGIGDFTCPKCKYRATTSNFRYVGDDKEKTNPSGK